MDVFAVPHLRLAWVSLFSQVELEGKEDRHPLDTINDSTLLFCGKYMLD